MRWPHGLACRGRGVDLEVFYHRQHDPIDRLQRVGIWQSVIIDKNGEGQLAAAVCGGVAGESVHVVHASGLGPDPAGRLAVLEAVEQ